jgi:hypothetical protein
MAKHETDPVLEQLVRAVNDSGRARVPVTVSAHGREFTGVLIAQQAYFEQLATDSPLLSALQPESGLLGKDYAKDVDAESGHHLHIRAAAGEEGLWRINIESVDAWSAGVSPAAEEDKGPFARLLGA